MISDLEKLNTLERNRCMNIKWMLVSVIAQIETKCYIPSTNV